MAGGTKRLMAILAASLGAGTGYLGWQELQRNNHHQFLQEAERRGKTVMASDRQDNVRRGVRAITKKASFLAEALKAMKAPAMQIPKGIGRMGQFALEHPLLTAAGAATAGTIGTKMLDVAGQGLGGIHEKYKQYQLHQTQEGVLEQLVASDEILQQADPEFLESAYGSMRRFAPILATDENAVRSFLREAVMYGTGPDFAMISNMSKAERTINPPQGTTFSI